jgi:hypothetical protein
MVVGQVHLEKYLLDWKEIENLVCNLVALVMIGLNVFVHLMEGQWLIDGEN